MRPLPLLAALLAGVLALPAAAQKTDTGLPGMRINTSPSDFAPIQQMQLARFNGKTWALFGELISSEY